MKNTEKFEENILIIGVTLHEHFSEDSRACYPVNSKAWCYNDKFKMKLNLFIDDEINIPNPNLIRLEDELHEAIKNVLENFKVK